MMGDGNHGERWRGGVAWSWSVRGRSSGLALRHQHRLDRLGRRVLDGPGRLDAAFRRAAFRSDMETLPEDVRVYVAKVHDHAYRVTDRDVEAILALGYTQDQIFELTVAAAVGAGLGRLERARRAMGQA
jgi:hypothetical protein